LNFKESKELFEKIFLNQMSVNEIRDILIELYKKGESAEEIAGAMTIMKNHSLKVIVPKELQNKIFDNCGTGGDKSGSFNISTTVAFVLAGAGVYVAKHGNRSITSKSGSGDVLEKLGLKLNLTPAQHSIMIQEAKFTFMFAPHHHLAMKHIMPIRKSIPHRTIFNILGPLSSPANVKKQLIGVFDSKFIDKIINALKITDIQNGTVVSSKDGLDEVSISDITYFATIKNNQIQHGEIIPENFGIKMTSFNEIKGGDSELNSKILLGILNNSIQGAKKDIVLLNSAVAFYTYGMARDIKDGLEIAKNSIESGKALKQFKFILDLSNKI
jgi:anthranilate phosphoribosyltransferase